MRVVREFTHEPLRISIFSWQEKFMVKIEYGPYEQWFKFKQEEYTLDKIILILDDAFLKEAERRFVAMHESLKASYQRSNS